MGRVSKSSIPSLGSPMSSCPLSLPSGAGKTGQPLGKEIVFYPLYSLASFVKDKVSTGVLSEVTRMGTKPV